MVRCAVKGTRGTSSTEIPFWIAARPHRSCKDIFYICHLNSYKSRFAYSLVLQQALALAVADS